MKFFHVLVLIQAVIFISSCFFSKKKDMRVIKLYKNSSSIAIPNEETRMAYELIAKIENKYDEPILVPFIQDHLIPVEQGFECSVRGDSLVNISWYGTGDYFYYGLDTLYPQETQRNFVLLSEYNRRVRSSAYNFISFEYYLLTDFKRDPWNSDFAKYEFFLIHQDTADILQIHQPETEFNPYKHRSYPIPK